MQRIVLGGGLGLGIDIDHSKIEQTRACGYNAILFDINKIPDEKLVQFTVLSHFLEHVPNWGDVKSFIRKAITISNEFVYIQQPFFDADCYLFDKGLKLFLVRLEGASKSNDLVSDVAAV